MVKRPFAVIVAPHTLSVTYEKGLSSRAGAVGLCGPETQEIHLDAELGKTIEKETLLHECMHACWTQTELDKKYKDSDEESICWTLAPRLLALLRDNEGLVAWLTEK